jgi:ABC-type Fe3+ transport system substrate-binding protein
MYANRTQWFSFALFFVLSIVVFIAAIVSPPIRALAPAPLRDFVLPEPDPIVLNVLYSTEKEDWLNEVVPVFEAERFRVDGRPIEIEMEGMGSREMYLAVLDGSKEPDLISPASSLQISILQDLSTSKFGAPMVDLRNTEECRSVVQTPLVLVAWLERAEELWGTSPGADLWDLLHAAMIDPEGWAAFGHPDWGYLKFGHSDPLRSNSGFMTILLMTYAYHNKLQGLQAEDILSDPSFQEWFLDIEDSIPEFPYSTGPLMRKAVVYGPSTFDLVAVYEATAIEHAENAVGTYGELRVFYPPATVWSDHPFCILNAEWVEPEKVVAAKLFMDFLTDYPAQESAVRDHGFRPVHPEVPLDMPNSPFTRYAENGIRMDLSDVPPVEVPEGNVLNTLLEFWARNVIR